MPLDPSIILSGRTPDIVGQAARANQMAASQANALRQADMSKMLMQNGPGIVAGDQNALNALSRYDPTAALGVQQTRQSMEVQAENLRIARQDARMRAEQYATQLTEAQKAEAAAKIEAGLKGAAEYYAAGDEAGYNAWLKQNGMDPAQYPMSQFPAVAASVSGVYDALTSAETRNAPATRKIIKGADGFNYYQDTGERVLPDVQGAPLSSAGKTQADIAAGRLPAGTPLRPQGTTVNVGGGGSYTPFWRKVDEGFAETYIDWKGGKGADAASQVASISHVLDQLEAGDPITGPQVGIVPDFALALVNPTAADAKDLVEGVVQRSLRETLGAQFTEKEGARLIARAYNPTLRPEANARRLKALYGVLNAGVQAKDSMVAYVDQHGTLQGYDGPGLPSVADFDAALDAVDLAPAASDQAGRATDQPAQPDQAINPDRMVSPSGFLYDPEILKGLTPEEISLLATMPEDKRALFEIRPPNAGMLLK